MQILIMLFFLLVWLFILWIGAIALESTGLERSRARFQALSALSGTGFTTGKDGQAGTFNGSNGYVDLGAFNGFGSVKGTIAGWVNIQDDVGVSHQRMFGVFNSGNNAVGAIGYQYVGNEWNFAFHTPGWREIFGGGQPIEGGWYHIAGTWNGKSLKIYLNGKLSKAKNWSGSSELNESPLTIGGPSFTGTVDEVKFYNRTLTDEEILRNFEDKSQQLAVVSVTKAPILWGKLKGK